jgi:DNA-binding response OmpR family regulator
MLREDEDRGVYPRGMKIVLLTARNLSPEPDRERIFLDFSRADTMLYKPFDLEELVAQVGDVLLGEAARLPVEEPQPLAF